MRLLIGLIGLSFLSLPISFSNDEEKLKKKVDFESLLIEGQRRDSSMIVITGDEQAGRNGMLMMKKNFLNQMAMDLGEKVEDASSY